MGQCDFVTAKGTQCTRSNTKLFKGVPCCTQHYNVASKKSADAPITTKTPEPWVSLQLSAPFASNGSKTIQKIRRKLQSGPKATDGPGTIYIYSIHSESKLNYWKIGMTERDVDTRMNEWATEHKNKKIVLERTFIVKQNHAFIERVIHLYLAYCRMYRYPHKSGFHSTWYLDPDEIINDGQQLTSTKNHELVARRKHVEWFCAPIEKIYEVIKPIISICAKMKSKK